MARNTRANVEERRNRSSLSADVEAEIARRIVAAAVSPTFGNLRKR